MSRQPADDLLYIDSIFDRDGISPLRGTAWNDTDRIILKEARCKVLAHHRALIRLVEATKYVVCSDGSELMKARDAAVETLRKEES